MPKPDPRELAAEWLARVDAGLTAGEQAEFEGWLAADPRHAAAWRELQATWEVLDRPREIGAAEGMIHELGARRRRRRVRWTASVAAGAMAAVCVVVLTPRFATTKTETEIGVASGTWVRSEPERRTLPDGSVVELSTGAEIDMTFSPARRLVQLRRGVAHFTVTKDPARPFVVAADAAEVRAVGTAFIVRTDGAGADVVVTEGTVAVQRAVSTPAAATLVQARQRVAVPAEAAEGALKVQALSATELARLEAWRAPRLVLNDTPLAELVEEMNRENALKLVIEDATLQRMKLSGVLRADDAEGFVRLLEANYAVRAEHVSENRVVLRAKG